MCKVLHEIELYTAKRVHSSELIMPLAHRKFCGWTPDEQSLSSDVHVHSTCLKITNTDKEYCTRISTYMYVQYMYQKIITMKNSLLFIFGKNMKMENSLHLFFWQKTCTTCSNCDWATLKIYKNLNLISINSNLLH